MNCGKEDSQDFHGRETSALAIKIQKKLTDKIKMRWGQKSIQIKMLRNQREKNRTTK